MTTLLRAVVNYERRAWARKITCPFWRFALSAGIMAGAGSLIDASPIIAFIVATVGYVLVDWDWVRIMWAPEENP